MTIGNLILSLTLVSIWCSSMIEARSVPPEVQINNAKNDGICRGMPCEEYEETKRKLQQVGQKQKGFLDLHEMPEAPEWMDDDCIVYTPEQADEFLNSENDDVINIATKAADNKDSLHIRKKRKIEDMDAYPERKWNNPILYKFDGRHSDSEREIIRRAFQHWEQHTCVRFFEMNSDAVIKQSHLLLTRDSGCYSFVGKTKYTTQQINLAPLCLTQFGIPVHEIGHALGLWHEHQRSDRDAWIKVNFQNIAHYESQFYKRDETVSLGVPYDYTSVMHYGAKAGSSNKQFTLEPIDSLYTLSMGQRAELSYLDAKIINNAYCKDKCRDRRPVQCQRGGYQDPNNCDQCVCPDGFGGPYCEEAAKPTRDHCGGHIDLTRPQTIQTPGYDNPGFYEDFTECSWVVKAPENQKIELTFEKDKFGLYCQHSETCFHWVEIKYKTDFEYPGPRFCCYNNPTTTTLTSETNEMVIIFKSNYPTSYERTRIGFKAHLTSVPIPGELTTIPEVLKPVTKPETTTQTTTTTKSEPEGTHWSDWSGCTGHQCQCGGCSQRTRVRLCGNNLCEGDLAAKESITCDRVCENKDKYLVFTAKFHNVSSCPVCCSGFTTGDDGKCHRND